MVEFTAGLIDQRVDPRVGEVSAVGAVGREFGGVEKVFEYVRVFVAADPAQRIELEQAVGDVGEESREFLPGVIAVAGPPPSGACFLRWTISW